MTWPFKNDTGSIVRKLSFRSLQHEKRRNIMVVTAVALAAFLISFGGGLEVSMLQMQHNQTADTWEAVYSGISEQDLAMIKEQPGIASAGEYYLIGEELSAQGFIGSFIYADEAMLYIGRKQMKLLEGRLPERADEIMVSEGWRNDYAGGAGIGDAVSLSTDSFQDAYIISGIMDTGSKNYSFIISRELLMQYPGYNPSGYRAYVHLKNVTEMNGEEIKAYCDAIADDYDISSPAYNSMYFESIPGSQDTGTVAVIGLAAFIIVIGGCIVIQSIFRISVIEKIQSFGQLRTVGATKSQISQIVRKEGRRLGWPGIIAGTAAGIIISVSLIPDGFHLSGYTGVMIAATVICRIMIEISMRNPVKIAAGITPIEAVRFVSEQKSISRGRRSHKRINPLSLGIMNFIRDRKRTVSIIVSLSFGGILLLCASTLLLLYSPDTLTRKLFPNGDYKIYVSSDKDTSDLYESDNPLTEDLRRQILEIDGVSEVIIARRSAGCDFQAGLESYGGMADMITQDNYQAIEDALTEGKMPADGHSILVTDIFGGIRAGSSIQITLGGKESSVTVSGILDISKVRAGYGHGNLGLDGALLYLPEDLFKELLPGVKSFDYSWDIVSDPNRDVSVKAKLQKLINSRTDIALDTFSDTRIYYKSVYSNLFHAMQGAALFISLFGILNLINTTLSNQIARERENTILRSLGLTEKQLWRMISVEGTGYVLLSILLTILAGLPPAFLMHCKISAIVFGAPTDFQFPFLYMVLYFLLLLLIQSILSAWSIRKHEKRSLIAQLRSFE